ETTLSRSIHAADDPLLNPLVLAGQHRLGQPITASVGIVTQSVEVPPDAQPRWAAEVIDQSQHLALVSAGARRDKRLGPRAGRRDGEQLRRDFHDPPNKHLLAL